MGQYPTVQISTSDTMFFDPECHLTTCEIRQQGDRKLVLLLPEHAQGKPLLPIPRTENVCTLPHAVRHEDR
jgi:hypothetical protein